MGNNAVSPYQQVIEKTKSLSFRSQMLAMNIEKKLNQSGRSEVGISFVFLISCCLFLREINLSIILNLRLNSPDVLTPRNYVGKDIVTTKTVVLAFF